MNEKPITLAMTGASGAIYGLTLLQQLLAADKQVYLLISGPAQVVLNMETDLKVPSQPKDVQQLLSTHYQAQEGQLQVFGKEQWTAPIASGTNVSDAMVVCPCTSGTLAAIANGTSDSLLERAADVVIKENKKLILVPREMPLSAIHLEHMLKLSRIGVTIMPANPGFYHKPASVQDLVDFVVARILDHLNIEHELLTPWGNH